MEDRNFVVYAHYTLDTNELFYIGEGRPERSKRKTHRNKYWHHKVNKHGFKVEIIRDNLTKAEAEAYEEELIKEEFEKGTRLTNMSIGPMFKNHWLIGRTKEDHPRYGVRFDAPWIVESNKRRTGQKLKPRPDLSERNKAGNFKRFKQSIQCVETGQVFNSVKEAAEWAGTTPANLSKCWQRNNKSAGYHWRKVGEA